MSAKVRSGKPVAAISGAGPAFEQMIIASIDEQVAKGELLPGLSVALTLLSTASEARKVNGTVDFGALGKECRARVLDTFINLLEDDRNDMSQKYLVKLNAHAFPKEYKEQSVVPIPELGKFLYRSGFVEFLENFYNLTMLLSTAVVVSGHREGAFVRSAAKWLNRITTAELKASIASPHKNALDAAATLMIGICANLGKCEPGLKLMVDVKMTILAVDHMRKTPFGPHAGHMYSECLRLFANLANFSPTGLTYESTGTLSATGATTEGHLRLKHSVLVHLASEGAILVAIMLLGSMVPKHGTLSDDGGEFEYQDLSVFPRMPRSFLFFDAARLLTSYYEILVMEPTIRADPLVTNVLKPTVYPFWTAAEHDTCSGPITVMDSIDFQICCFDAMFAHLTDVISGDALKKLPKTVVPGIVDHVFGLLFDVFGFGVAHAMFLGGPDKGHGVADKDYRSAEPVHPRFQEMWEKFAVVSRAIRTAVLEGTCKDPANESKLVDYWNLMTTLYRGAERTAEMVRGAMLLVASPNEKTLLKQGLATSKDLETVKLIKATYQAAAMSLRGKTGAPELLSLQQPSNLPSIIADIMTTGLVPNKYDAVVIQTVAARRQRQAELGALPAQGASAVLTAATGLGQNMALKQCGLCKAKADDVALKLCNGCHLQRYCSAECQKADWKKHKEMCKVTRQAKEEHAAKKGKQ